MINTIEVAQGKGDRLTGLKVVDGWKGIRGKGSLANTSVESCERVLVHCILEGVLKEEFHFTPYSTISYVGLGRKAVSVKNGMMKVRMKTAQGTGGGRGGGGGPSGVQSSSRKATPQKTASLVKTFSTHSSTPAESLSSTSTTPTQSRKAKPIQQNKGKEKVPHQSLTCATKRLPDSVTTKDQLIRPGKSTKVTVSDSDSENSNRDRTVLQRKRVKRRKPASSSSDEDFMPVAKRRPQESKSSEQCQRQHEVIDIDSD